MTYCLGLLLAAVVITVVRRVVRINIFSSRSGFLSAYNLHYFGIGFLIVWFFPGHFMSLYEQNMGIALMFCLFWIGLMYGSSLEIRDHRKYTSDTIIFQLLEPLVTIVVMTVFGMVVDIAIFKELKHPDVVFFIAVFSSIGLFKHSVTGRSEGVGNSVVNNLAPIRNIIPIIAFCVAGSLFFTFKAAAPESSWLSADQSFVLINVAVGFSSGVIFSYLISGAMSAGSISVVLIGGSALFGGISDALLISPIFTGMISGAFIINSTLKRHQIIDSFSHYGKYIDKIFMFLLGTLMMATVTVSVSELQYLTAAVLIIVLVRFAIKYGITSLQIRKKKSINESASLLWTGLSGQGLLAAGAVVEFKLRFPQKPSVFLLLAFALVLTQFITGMALTENNRSDRGSD